MVSLLWVSPSIPVCTSHHVSPYVPPQQFLYPCNNYTSWTVFQQNLIFEVFDCTHPNIYDTIITSFISVMCRTAVTCGNHETSRVKLWREKRTLHVYYYNSIDAIHSQNFKLLRITQSIQFCWSSHSTSTIFTAVKNVSITTVNCPVHVHFTALQIKDPSVLDGIWNVNPSATERWTTRSLFTLGFITCFLLPVFPSYWLMSITRFLDK